MSQVEIFGRVAGVTGLVMTKFDGNDLAREVEKW
jgi:signal recognition particle GTPase